MLLLKQTDIQGFAEQGCNATIMKRFSKIKFE